MISARGGSGVCGCGSRRDRPGFSTCMFVETDPPQGSRADPRQPTGPGQLSGAGRPAAAGADESLAPADETASWFASDLPIVRILGAIVAPTTVLTAILFYFGWSRAYYFYDYFGVDATLLGLTTQDYLQLSVDGLFVPLTVAACAGLVVLWGRMLLCVHIASVPRILLPLTAVAGLILFLNGLSRIFTDTVFNRPPAVAPLSLAAGALLLVYVPRLSRSPRPRWVSVLEWAVVFVLVGVSLFWSANDYSAAAIHARAGVRQTSRCGLLGDGVSDEPNVAMKIVVAVAVEVRPARLRGGRPPEAGADRNGLRNGLPRGRGRNPRGCRASAGVRAPTSVPGSRPRAAGSRGSRCRR